jgi:hypothetical protein
MYTDGLGQVKVMCDVMEQATSTDPEIVATCDMIQQTESTDSAADGDLESLLPNPTDAMMDVLQQSGR